ncbi:MAG: molybdenum cofactor guanylyltransferase [Thermomicrobiales bacterium]
MNAPLTAAILVGGRSRRMGQDKALLPLVPDGLTVIETVVQTLATVADEITLVGAEVTARDYAFLGLRHVPDIVAGAGALGGIHAALTAASHERTLIVACDMPFLNADLLRHMASMPRDDDALVPLLGQPQPLHAIYGRSCCPLIEANLRKGQYRVTGWFARAALRLLPRSAIAAFDPSLHSCFNMNTPDDLAVARRIANGIGHDPT